MNIEYFSEGLEYLLYTGHKLSHEKKFLIENSLILLQNENHFANIYFWGRINGIAKDYYIAYGYKADCLRDRKFFYSTDCYQWQLLPFVQSPKVFQATILCREPFYGDPLSTSTTKLVSNYENVCVLIEMDYLFFP